MLHRVLNLIHKELIQFGRDRLLAGFILFAPLLQLLLLAQATGRGIADQPVVVVDLDRGALGRQIIAGMDNTEELAVRFYTEDMAAMRRLLDSGQARLAVVIPEGLSRPGAERQIQVVVDGTNTVAASISLGAAAGVINRFSANLAEGYGLVVPELVDFRSNVRFNPTLNSRHYTIPAQLGLIIFQVTLAVASLGLARERELGTLEQIMVSPFRRLEVALGKAVPAVAIGEINFLVMFAVSLAVFRVPMNGSPLVLGGLTLLFVMAVANWGVAISSVSHTQQQAILFIFIEAMVEITLSGFLVPVRNMPGFLQAVSYLSPLQHYLVIIRAVMLKGAGLDALWPEALALALLSAVMGLIGLRGVIRRLD